jgi:hypothetical protein
MSQPACSIGNRSRPLSLVASLPPSSVFLPRNTRNTRKGSTDFNGSCFRSFCVFTARRHLSPDGGSSTRTPTTAWQRMATAWQRMATIRQSTRVGQTLDRAWLANQNRRFARNKRRSDHLPEIPQGRTANNLYLCTAYRIRPVNAGSLCSN